jgi:hypothetical protein
VYSRISHQVDWIQATVCPLSIAPPAEFNCASRVPPSGDPITVTVSIRFDEFPDETGWTLVDATSYIVIASRPAGYYDVDEYPRRTVQEDFTLIDGASYLFSIHDLYGDGMSNPGPGSYQIIVQDTGLVLESGGGNFGFVETVEFTAARAPTSEPSASPTDVPSSSPSDRPSARPSASPSALPSARPSASPSGSPTISMVRDTYLPARVVATCCDFLLQSY